MFSGNVLWLGVTSFFSDVASEMIYPLLPTFLTSTLGASTAFLGLIEGAAESTASLVKLGGGWLSERLGRRKPLAVWGYGVAAVARPLISVAAAPWHVLAARLADRVGKGVRTAPRDALLAESVAPGVRGRAFGVQRAMDHAGAVVGPLIAVGVLALAPGRYRALFALALIPGAAAALVVRFKVREIPPPRERTSPLPRPSLAPFDADFKRYLAAVLVFTLGNASDAFLLLRAESLGIPVLMLPLLWSAFHVSKMVWSVPGGALADRVGPRRAILAGWVLYAAVYSGFGVASAAWQAWALFLVYGLFYGLTEAPERALTADLAPQELRGLAFGTYHFAIGLGALPAGLLFGALWAAFGAPTAFFVGAAFAALGAALLLQRPPAPARRAGTAPAGLPGGDG